MAQTGQADRASLGRRPARLLRGIGVVWVYMQPWPRFARCRFSGGFGTERSRQGRAGGRCARIPGGIRQPGAPRGD